MSSSISVVDCLLSADEFISKAKWQHPLSSVAHCCHFNTVSALFGVDHERHVFCLHLLRPSFRTSLSKTNISGCHVSGKVREKQNFLQVRELSGNFEKMSGNFVHLTSVRELSGNFVMTVNFFPKMISLL